MTFSRYLQMYHGLEESEVERDGNSVGWWRIKEPCGGQGTCTNPIHFTVGNASPISHTIHFRDCYRNKKGQFANKSEAFKTWFVWGGRE